MKTRRDNSMQTIQFETISLGQRFHTSSAQLDAATTFDASYDTDGPREEVPGD